MQSYLRYRRYGAELKALQQQDHEHFHRQHSHTLQDRASLHQALHSGHSRHAALGDQLYLAVASLVKAHDSSKHAQATSKSDPPKAEAVNDPEPVVDGIKVQDSEGTEGHEAHQVFVVNFLQDDPDDPHNWSMVRRILCVLQVASIGFLALFSSSVDAAVAPQAAAALDVSDVVESLATGAHTTLF